jgi:uncharacterized protein YukE
MAVWGLDVEQVRTLATQLDTKAGEIEAIRDTLTNTLGGTQWTGPDSEQFRNDWGTTYTRALNDVAQALKDTAQRARTNAQDQENVSNAR